MKFAKELKESRAETFTLRPATMADLDAVTTLINRAGMDQVGRPLTNVSELSDDWNMARFDLNDSTRVAELADGRIVGYLETWDIDPVPVNNWVWARVDPQYEGQGVGTALMTWAEQRLQSTVTRVPEDTRITFQSAANSDHAPSKKLFEDLGMQFVRRFWHMMIEFDGPPPESK